MRCSLKFSSVSCKLHFSTIHPFSSTDPWLSPVTSASFSWDISRRSRPVEENAFRGSCWSNQGFLWVGRRKHPSQMPKLPVYLLFNHRTSSAVCQQTHTCGHCPELTAVGEGPNVDWMIDVNAFDRVNVQVHSSESSNLTKIRDRFEEWMKTNWNKEQAESTLDLHPPCTVFAAAARQTPPYLRHATTDTMAVYDAPAVEMVWLQAVSYGFSSTTLCSQ